jgi:VacB/RNase II family 3'-5' exoribonuclease
MFHGTHGVLGTVSSEGLVVHGVGSFPLPPSHRALNGDTAFLNTRQNTLTVAFRGNARFQASLLPPTVKKLKKRNGLISVVPCNPKDFGCAKCYVVEEELPPHVLKYPDHLFNFVFLEWPDNLVFPVVQYDDLPEFDPNVHLKSASVVGEEKEKEKDESEKKKKSKRRKKSKASDALEGEEKENENDKEKEVIVDEVKEISESLANVEIAEESKDEKTEGKKSAESTGNADSTQETKDEKVDTKKEKSRRKKSAQKMDSKQSEQSEEKDKTKEEKSKDKKKRKKSKSSGDKEKDHVNSEEAVGKDVSKKGKTKIWFEEHLTKEKVKEAIESGKLVRGQIRVNSKNPSKSYVVVPGFEKDILIDGHKHRNRAFHDDIVAVELLPKEVSKGSKSKDVKSLIVNEEKADAKNNEIKTDDVITSPLAEIEGEDIDEDDDRPRGKVVSIIEKVDRKGVVGWLRIDENTTSSETNYIFVPQDGKIPLGIIYREKSSKTSKPGDLPLSLFSNFELLKKTLIEVNFEHWKPTLRMPKVSFVKVIGQLGELRSEVAALLIRYRILHTQDFPAPAMECLEEFQSWNESSVLEDNTVERLDLRSHRIFSIDPLTARDLDDALSITKIGDGRYKCGVHIADVSHFVKSGNALDVEAARRSTSVYLMDRVIPMLPRLLCEKLCSLNPGVDRFAFSVFWEMGDDAIPDWKTVKFSKSIIRSCVKLDYDSVQNFIDGKLVTRDIQYFGHSVEDVIEDCKMLNKLAVTRRKFRMDTGSLSLDKIKLRYNLDGDGLPIEFHEYKRTESHYLVEEFMLLANEMAARKIVENYPESALLRRHPPPGNLEKLLSFCQSFNISSDLSSAMEIQKAMDELKLITCKGNDAQIHMGSVLEHLFTKCMKPAEYFCVKGTDPNDWRHFNLNLSSYTHFTSPIRRYADLVVHRMLAKLLISPQDQPESIRKISDVCNERKLSTRRLAQDLDVLYFCHYVSRFPTLSSAVIIDIAESAFRVAVISLGVEARITLADLKTSLKASSAEITGGSFGMDRKIIVRWDSPSDQPKETENPVEEKTSTIEFYLFHEIQVRLGMRDSRRVDVFAEIVIDISPHE